MAAHLEWKEDYCLGFEPIDAQHRTLVMLLDTLYGAVVQGTMTPSQFGRILDQLILYVETHLDYEEKIFRFAGVPELEAHTRQHEEMRLRTHGLAVSLRGDLDDQVRETLNVVCEWWLNHILLKDREALPYLRQTFG